MTMINSKKIALIFLLFVILPVVFPLFGKCFIIGEYFFEYQCSGPSFLAFSFLPIIGAFIIFFLNYKSNLNSKWWYGISLLVILISIFYLYSLYSLSNFGF